MAKLKFHLRNGEVILPTSQERIADALAEIKNGVAGIDDPRVWSGYPDGWTPGDQDDEDDCDEPVGLFLNLERCTRASPTWQMAMAIETAFALGKLSENRDVDVEALRERLLTDWRRRNGEKRGDVIRQEADDRWRAKGKEKWLEARGAFAEDDPRCKSQGIVTKIIELEVPGAPDRDTVLKEIKRWDKELRVKGFWRPAWKPKRKVSAGVGPMGA
jgi:hypothetical protein